MPVEEEERLPEGTIYPGGIFEGLREASFLPQNVETDPRLRGFTSSEFETIASVHRLGMGRYRDLFFDAETGKNLGHIEPWADKLKNADFKVETETGIALLFVCKSTIRAEMQGDLDDAASNNNVRLRFVGLVLLSLADLLVHPKKHMARTVLEFLGDLAHRTFEAKCSVKAILAADVARKTKRAKEGLPVSPRDVTKDTFTVHLQLRLLAMFLDYLLTSELDAQADPFDRAQEQTTHKILRRSLVLETSVVEDMTNHIRQLTTVLEDAFAEAECRHRTLGNVQNTAYWDAQEQTWILEEELALDVWKDKKGSTIDERLAHLQEEFERLDEMKKLWYQTVPHMEPYKTHTRPYLHSVHFMSAPVRAILKWWDGGSVMASLRCPPTVPIPKGVQKELNSAWDKRMDAAVKRSADVRVVQAHRDDPKEHSEAQALLEHGEAGELALFRRICRVMEWRVYPKLMAAEIACAQTMCYLIWVGFIEGVIGDTFTAQSFGRRIESIRALRKDPVTHIVTAERKNLATFSPELWVHVRSRLRMVATSFVNSVEGAGSHEEIRLKLADVNVRLEHGFRRWDREDVARLVDFGHELQETESSLHQAILAYTDPNATDGARRGAEARIERSHREKDEKRAAIRDINHVQPTLAGRRQGHRQRK